ncbi:LAGLIDADG family homing endonuclease [Romboutsia sp.]|uniref:LAGLIDADG family homing endonuclease n=1 Tax=Romboutsia sp. TaxID=1965302 RepID=UPI003F2BF1CE
MYPHICEKCNKNFESRKKQQKYCSKSCANSVNTSKRKIEDESIYVNGLNRVNSYILGLIYSDGCVSFDEHTKKYRITIAMNDFDIMDNIHTIMTPNKKLYSYTHPNGRCETYSVISTNKNDIDFLFNIGIKPRKSLDITYPKIDKKFDSDFIRGYFDGDGSVYESRTYTYYKGIKKEYKYKYFKITTGSKEFAYQLSQKLLEYNICSNITQDSRSSNSSYYVSIYKKDSVINFFNLIYDEAELFMSRKYDKFINMI